MNDPLISKLDKVNLINHKKLNFYYLPKSSFNLKPRPSRKSQLTEVSGVMAGSDWLHYFGDMHRYLNWSS